METCNIRGHGTPTCDGKGACAVLPWTWPSSRRYRDHICGWAGHGFGHVRNPILKFRLLASQYITAILKSHSLFMWEPGMTVSSPFTSSAHPSFFHDSLNGVANLEVKTDIDIKKKLLNFEDNSPCSSRERFLGPKISQAKTSQNMNFRSSFGSCSSSRCTCPDSAKSWGKTVSRRWSWILGWMFFWVGSNGWDLVVFCMP